MATSFSFVTSTAAGGGANLSSSVSPFYIPLHFQNEKRFKKDEIGSSSKQQIGPKVPSKDWRKKWKRSPFYDGNLPNGLKRLAKQQPKDVWIDDELDRWVTSITVWDVEGQSKVDCGAVESTPEIRIEDSIGEVELDKPNTEALFGNIQGGRRIALGTQDGNVWILQESYQQEVLKEKSYDQSYESVNMTPSTSLNGISGLQYRSNGSRSSIALITPTSPTSVGSKTGELDTVTSPVIPMSATTEVIVSATPNQSNNSGMDAEEYLERQWHAGRENQGMMSGMMEALGINQGSQSHDHLHQHLHEHGTRHNSGTSTPTRRQRKSSATHSHTRSRHGSTVDREEDGKNDIKSAIANIGLKGTLGTGAGQKKKKESHPDSHEKNRRPIQPIEPILSLQCPTNSPIIALKHICIDSNKDSLVVLQDDGELTLWPLEGSLQPRTIDLKSAKAPPIDRVDEHAATQPTTYFSSSLARLAALRSNAPSPQPRSRANSTPSSPTSILETISLPVVSSFESVCITKTSAQLESMSHIQAFYDKAKMRLHIVDCERWMVIFQHSFDTIGLANPTLTISENNESIEVYFLNQKGSLEIENHRIKPKVKHTIPTDTQKLAPISSASAFLRREGISRPNSRPASIIEEVTEPKSKLGDVGIEKEAKGLFSIDNRFILTWSEMGLSVAKHVGGDSLFHSDTLTMQGIIDVEVDKRVILVRLDSQILLFEISSKGELNQVKSYEIDEECDIATLTNSYPEPVLCLRDENDRFLLKSGTRKIWENAIATDEDDNASNITASLPFSMERIVLSLSSGHLVICPMVDLIAGQIPQPKDLTSSHCGNVTLLQTVTNPRTNSRHIIGGTEEGDVILWDATTLKCQMQRSILASPIVAFVALGNQDNALRLHGCVACIGADSTIAFIVLDDMQLLYIVPGRDAPLELIAVRSNELMTIYADGRARVWSAIDLELRRSIGVDQALVLLEDGKGWWSQFPINVAHLKRERGNIGVLSSIPSCRSSFGGAMTADVRRVVEAASRMVAPLKASGNTNGRDPNQIVGLEHLDENADPLASLGHTKGSKPNLSLSLAMPQGKKALHTLRPLLCCLLPFGISETFDERCRTVLNISTESDYSMSVITGLFSEPGFLALSFHGMDAQQALSIAPAITATRLVASIAMLLVLANIAELQKSALELISLLDNLSNLVGPSIQQPSIEFLIGFLTDPVLEIKQAAQMLFVSSLEGMPQEELDAICTQFNDSLPNRRTAIAKEMESDSLETSEEEVRHDQHSSKALLLLGLIATQRYTVMPPNLLKDIAMSISLYLNDDEDPTHQSIAIVLCDRGFSIFQHYFDAMEVVRTIFSLSTTLQTNPGNINESTTNNRKSIPNAAQIALENRDLARQATLRIAEENTPLFMTTLSLDILHARSPEHCSATMRLVAFMVRRKPLVLYPNLPRLAEAVVKSLDPTVTTLRAVIHKSATIIISELISAYPTIAFHKGTQRLAVGTFEGAIIMYDLKTATRLYVLEAHGTSLNGLTFSNDGRRLISICLQDGMVKVWKTGTGLGSLFSFGAAPRQMGALLARATGVGNEAERKTEGNESRHPHSSDLSNTGTPPYKSFDFGRMAGSALASVRLAAAIRSPPLSAGAGMEGGLLSPRGSITSGHAISLIEREEEEAAFMSDLQLIRFEWLAERSIKIRIGEASLVFDVA